MPISGKLTSLFIVSWSLGKLILPVFLGSVLEVHPVSFGVSFSASSAALVLSLFLLLVVAEKNEEGKTGWRDQPMHLTEVNVVEMGTKKAGAIV